MIRRSRFQFRGQLSGPGIGELIGMNAQLESKPFGSGQKLSRLLNVEVTVLAENIAKFRQPFCSNSRQHLLNYEVDVFICAAFTRNGVRAQECRNKLNR